MTRVIKKHKGLPCAFVMLRLAEKPADRNVKSEDVINSLQTTATLEQFIKMLEQVLDEGIPITA